MATDDVMLYRAQQVARVLVAHGLELTEASHIGAEAFGASQTQTRDYVSRALEGAKLARDELAGAVQIRGQNRTTG